MYLYGVLLNYIINIECKAILYLLTFCFGSESVLIRELITCKKILPSRFIPKGSIAVYFVYEPTSRMRQWYRLVMWYAVRRSLRITAV